MESIVDYSRQAEFDQALEGILPDQINYIVGCGGVGFWLAIILAMQGYKYFVLIDGQQIEKTNLNRLPVPPSWVGIKKATALRRVIRSLRPLTAIKVHTEHITEETFSILTHGSDGFKASKHVVAGGKRLYKTVWDCTDDARIQKKIFKAMKNISPEIHYRKIGYEGFQVGSYKAYDVWVPTDYAPGYRTSNACAATSALAAIVGLMTEGLGVVQDTELNIKTILQTMAATPTPEPTRVEDTTEEVL